MIGLLPIISLRHDKTECCKDCGLHSQKKRKVWLVGEDVERSVVEVQGVKLH